MHEYRSSPGGVRHIFPELAHLGIEHTVADGGRWYRLPLCPLCKLGCCYQRVGYENERTGAGKVVFHGFEPTGTGVDELDSGGEETENAGSDSTVEVLSGASDPLLDRGG